MCWYKFGVINNKDWLLWIICDIIKYINKFYYVYMLGIKIKFFIII